MVTPCAGGVLLRIKVVPGARSDEVAGIIAMPDGDRLKVKVIAPPEDGRANVAVCELLAQSLKLPKRSVSVIVGHTSREKTVQITGADSALIASMVR